MASSNDDKISTPPSSVDFKTDLRLTTISLSGAKNYLAWSTAVLQVVNSKGLHRHLTAPPLDFTDPTYDIWFQNDNKDLLRSSGLVGGEYEQNGLYYVDHLPSTSIAVSTIQWHCRLEHAHGHAHDPGVSSVSIVCEGSLDLEKANMWLGTLLMERSDDIYRMKGLISVEGMAERFVFQGVHDIFQGSPDRLWGADEPRINKIVFIGKNLDAQELEKGFKACLL